ncbi:MAG: glycosyltransferase family 39 protein, partial [Candidatus Erginobacter occultus]|nr:glycosyltransferase family 39 protein [Candidatus Erginobacter occultus]
RRHSRIPALGLAVLLAGLFCLRIPLVRDRYFNPDETEHIQVAYLISRGWVPHQDFFENHNLLFHFMLVPLIRMNDPLGTLFAARIVMLTLTAAIIALTYRIGRGLAGPRVGGWAAVGLLSNYVFFSKALEIRPGNLAIVCLLLTVFFFAAAIRKGHNSFWFLGGLASSLCLLSTQKTIFPLLGMAFPLAGFWFRQWTANRENRRCIWGQIAATGGGILLPAFLYLLYFIITGSMAGMIRDTLLFNLAYTGRISPFNYLREFLLFSPVFIFWSLAGLWGVGIALFRRRDQKPERYLVCGALIGGIAGTFILQVPYLQYYALFTPLAYILAAIALINFLEFLWNADLKFRASAGLALILPILLPVYVRYVTGYNYRFRLEDTDFWIGFAAAACSLSYLFSLLGPRKFARRAAGLALLAAVVVRPVNLTVHSYRHTNQHFRNLLMTVHRETGTDDRVLDGWTGLGLFRFPAYYYYFLHSGMIITLDPKVIGPEILRTLKSHPPAIVVKDDAFNHLPAEISDFVDNNYTILVETRYRGIPIRIYQRE